MYISINNNKFNCKVVSTPEKIRLGMMGQSFSNFDGMLFVMPEDTTQSFWMKNCVIPLILSLLRKILLMIFPLTAHHVIQKNVKRMMVMVVLYWNCLPIHAGVLVSKSETGLIISDFCHTFGLWKTN
jgi:hypothetical protein